MYLGDISDISGGDVREVPGKFAKKLPKVGRKLKVRPKVQSRKFSLKNCNHGGRRTFLGQAGAGDWNPAASIAMGSGNRTFSVTGRARSPMNAILFWKFMSRRVRTCIIKVCNGATNTSTGAAQRRRPHLAHLPLIRVELTIAKDPGLAKTGPEIRTIIGQEIGI